MISLYLIYTCFYGLVCRVVGEQNFLSWLSYGSALFQSELAIAALFISYPPTNGSS